MTIKIKDYKYKVLFVDKHSDFLLVDEYYRFGVCSYKNQIIYISNDLKGELLQRTLRHEFTHAIIEAYGLYAHRNDFDAEDVCEFTASYALDIVKKTNHIIGKLMINELKQLKQKRSGINEQSKTTTNI